MRQIGRVAVAMILFVPLACVGDGEANVGGAAAASTSRGDHGPTLQTVRARGALKCGISQAAGFATPDNTGRWQGFDVDFCRAMAVALFDDPAKAEFVPYTQQQRFAGLQSGEVDVLVNGTSLTSSRALRQAFHFGPIYFFDGQGFLVPRNSGVVSARGLNGATVCVQQGTTSELNLTDFARRSGIDVRPLVMDDLRGAVDALSRGRCDAITQDGAGLATTRTMLRRPLDYVVLPDRISKESIAPVVRRGDGDWLEFVNWVFRALVEAEELGIGRHNVASARLSDDPATRRLLGVEAGATAGLGLDASWVGRVIEVVGNYGEIFERNLGAETPLKIDRGANRLWRDGGLMYSPPFR